MAWTVQYGWRREGNAYQKVRGSLHWLHVLERWVRISWVLPVIGLNFTVVSKLLLLYSTTDKTSTLKMKSFSTVRVTQRGSQRYMEKRRGRRELEVLIDDIC